MGFNPNFASIGQQFVQHYYTLFDNAQERGKLAELYHESALFSFEDDQKQGRAPIMEKLKSLPFERVAHVITKVDCLPTPDGGVLIQVTGQVKVDNDKAHGYFHSFILKPENNTFFITHEIFRLALHNFQEA